MDPLIMFVALTDLRALTLFIIFYYLLI